MKFKIFLLVILGAMAAAGFWFFNHQTPLLEKGLNRAAKPYFADTLRFNRAELDLMLNLHVQGAKGTFQGAEGPYPVEIDSLESGSSLANLARQQPVDFMFSGVRMNGSVFKGMAGRVEAALNGSFRLEAQIEGVGLQDVVPFTAGNMRGAAGEMRGRIMIVSKPGSEGVLNIELSAQKPGGRIPSRFFAAFLPFLPDAQSQTELATLIRLSGVVSFDEANFKVDSAGPGRMKVFLHMRIPDYNLNLNLNVRS